MKEKKIPKIDSLPVTEFYFLRHAETVYNAMRVPYDDPHAILSDRGINQAHSVSEIIEGLSIKTVCVSPYLRARHTTQIVTRNISCSTIIIDHLKECQASVWDKMVALEHPDNKNICDTVFHFMDQVYTGINNSLIQPGPVLIVAHGGVHWALCHQMGINDHERDIDNCLPVHFYQKEKKWNARVLREPWSE